MQYLSSISSGYQKGFFCGLSVSDEFRKIKPTASGIIQYIHFSQLLASLEKVNVSIESLGFRTAIYISPFLPFSLMKKEFGLPVDGSIAFPFFVEAMFKYWGRYTCLNLCNSDYIMHKIAMAIVCGRITPKHIYEWRKRNGSGDLAVLESSVWNDYQSIKKWGEDQADNLPHSWSTNDHLYSNTPEIERILGPLLTETGILKAINKG